MFEKQNVFLFKAKINVILATYRYFWIDYTYDGFKALKNQVLSKVLQL